MNVTGQPVRLNHKRDANPAHQHRKNNPFAQGFAEQKQGGEGGERWVGVLQHRCSGEGQFFDGLKKAQQRNAPCDPSCEEKPSGFGRAPWFNPRQSQAHPGERQADDRANEHDFSDGDSAIQLLDADGHQTEGKRTENQGAAAFCLLTGPPRGGRLVVRHRFQNRGVDGVLRLRRMV